MDTLTDCLAPMVTVMALPVDKNIAIQDTAMAADMAIVWDTAIVQDTAMGMRQEKQRTGICKVQFNVTLILYNMIVRSRHFLLCVIKAFT